MGYTKDPKNLRKISLPMLDMRTNIATHQRAKATLPKTKIKAKIRTLLPKEN